MLCPLKTLPKPLNDNSRLERLLSVVHGDENLVYIARLNITGINILKYSLLGLLGFQVIAHGLSSIEANNEIGIQSFVENTTRRG
jgi:hypothetical protein